MEDKIKHIETVVTSLYKSISFKKGKYPDLQKLKTLFIKEARLIRTDKDDYKVMSVDEFTGNLKKQIEAGGFKEFREYEINGKIDLFGGIAQVFSGYEADFETVEGRMKTKGINSIQLVERNNEWKVVTILWYGEDEENKVAEIA
jgi:hypothetical protein